MSELRHADRDWVTARLAELGFLPPETEVCSEEAYRAAVLAYQGWHGLECDGFAGSVTGRHLAMPRFCGHPDLMRVSLDEALGKWPHTRITWRVVGTFPGHTAEQTAEILRRAFAKWAAVVSLEFVQVAADQRANITVRFGRIDGKGGVLAQSEVPVGARADTQLGQLYDSAEGWVWGRPTRPAEIDPETVAAHEIGHALGLGHMPAGSGNLMDPTYNPAVSGPQAGDRREILRLYPAATPDLPPPAAKVHTIKFDRPVTEVQVSGKAA